VLIDNAMELASVELPAPDAAEIRADLIEGLARLVRVGLTGAHDMATTPAELEALHGLEAESRLPLRVFAYLHGTEEELKPLLTRPPERRGQVQVVGIKLYADGTLGSRGAALLAPYTDRPDTCGLLVTSPDVLARRVSAAQRAGYQVAIHAIGDRGVRVALDAIESAHSVDHPCYHRLEHIQVVHRDDMPRFAAWRTVASMQPTHATSDMPWVESCLGGERLAGAYAWKSLLATGARLALGSDTPIEPENPWLGIHAAVTRQTPTGEPEGGWLADERISTAAAIAGFTSGAAHAAGATELGVIRVGAPADLTVVDVDPLAISPARLAAVKTLRTMVGGRQVYPEIE
jgi:predicted amidohydrolase YtcJ